MYIKINTQGNSIPVSDIDAERKRAEEAFDRLWSGSIPMTGWVKAPVERDEDETGRVLEAADAVKQKAELMVVIGIGGSYMGRQGGYRSSAEDGAGHRGDVRGNKLFFRGLQADNG